MAYDALPLIVPQGGTGNVFNGGSHSLILGGTTTTGNLQNSPNNPIGQSFVSLGSSTRGRFRNVNCWKLLNTTTATASSTITFTSLMSSTYSSYALIINGLVPNTGTPALKMQVSSDNGSSYIATNYQSGSNRIAYNGTTYTNANSTTEILLTMPTNTAFPTSGTILMNTGTSITMLPFVCFGVTGNGNTSQTTVASNTSITVNAFQIFFSSGTFAGTFSLFGISS